MKRLLLLSLFTSLLGPQVGLAQDNQNCSELAQNLGTTERSLMELKKENCEGSDCQTLGKANQSYNEAVADLVILEGLIAINRGITNSAEAIHLIKPDHIKEVKDHSKELLVNIEKAKFLDMFLKKEDDKITAELKTATNKADVEQMLDGIKTVSNQMADGVSKDQKFSNYRQNYLNHKVDGKVLFEDEDFQRQVQDLYKLASQEKLSNEDKQKLLEYSKSLPRIQSPTTTDDKLEGWNFERTIENYQSMTSTLLGIKPEIEKKKLQNLSTQLINLEKSKYSGLSQDFRKLGVVKTHCKDKDDKQCLTHLKSDPDLKVKYEELSIKDFESLKNKDNIETPKAKLLAALSNCYDQKDLESIQKCQMKIFDNNKDISETALSKAREAVTAAKKILDDLHSDSKIAETQKKKAQLFHRYSKLGCGVESNQANLSQGICLSKDLDGLVMNSAILTDLEGIVISIENKYQEEIIAQAKLDFEREQAQKKQDESTNSSNNGRSVAGNVSYAHFDNTVTKEDVKAEKRRIKELKKENRVGPSGAEYALQGLAQVTVTSAPQLMMLHQENQYIKSYAENYRLSMIQRQQYQSWLTQQQKYYGQLYATGNMNYGWGFYNPNYASNFNYPNNQYTFYQHGNSGFNFSQYNFLNPTLTPTTGTGTTTTTTTTPQFNFQF